MTPRCGGQRVRDRRTGFAFTLRAASPDGSPLYAADATGSQAGDPGARRAPSTCRCVHSRFAPLRDIATARAGCSSGSLWRRHAWPAEEVDYAPDMQACPAELQPYLLDVFKEPFAFQACHLSAFHSRLARQLDGAYQQMHAER